MYGEYSKMVREGFKPALKLAENNAALTVKLMHSHANSAADMIEANLAHMRAMVEVNDLNAAVELQQKHAESMVEKFASIARESTAAYEAAYTEAGKIFEAAYSDVQAEARKVAETFEKDVKKATKKAA